MEGTANGAAVWRRRRRNSGYAIAWGVVCCLAGLVYSLLAGGRAENATMDALSALGIVLLVVGMAIAGLGALGWVYAAAALPRLADDQRAVAPPPRLRLGVVAWVALVAVILAAFCLYITA